MKIKLKTTQWSDLLNLMNAAALGAPIPEDHRPNLQDLLAKISNQFGRKHTDQMMRADARARWAADTTGEDR